MNHRTAVVAVLMFLNSIAACPAWEITDFSADIRINPDSSLLVTETVLVDFGNESRHGIYRSIPTRYRDKYGNTVALRLEFIAATDATGQPYDMVETTTGRYRRLRLGSDKTTVTGQQTYRLQYRVQRAVTFFDDHTELYWNATGNEWPVTIQRARATVSLHVATGEGKIKALAFTGAYGATTGEATVSTDAQTARFETQKPLRPLEGLTVVVAWPKNLVIAPSAAQQLAWFVADNWALGLPVVVALLMTAVWYTRGRDPHGRGTVMVQYDAPGKLTPAELGTILDEKLDMRDISATIVDLAVRGYLQIKEIKRPGFLRDSIDYQFVRLKPYADDNNLLPHERAVLDGLFDGTDEFISLSNLEGRFYQQLPKIKNGLFDRLIANGYFAARPDRVRIGYRLVGIGLIVAGFVVAIIAFNQTRTPPAYISPALGIGLGLSGLVVLLFAPIMPRKTLRGVQALEETRGFEEYLSRAETAELQLQERENIFEKYLPYAMAFGVANLWAKRFEGKLDRAPQWYVGDSEGAFQPVLFTNRLGSCNHSMCRSLGTAPRSAGGSSWSSGGSGFSGGFSGGGGGGGGGGAW